MSAAKGREILKTKEKYPDFNMMEYDASIRDNLFFYNLEVEDSKKKKQWALDFWIHEGKDVKGFAKINDGYFLTAGAVAHMALHRKIDLSPKHYDYLTKKYIELSKMIVIEDEIIAPIIVKEDRSAQELSTHIAEFEGGVDLFFEGKVFDAKGYLVKHSVKPAVTKQIADQFRPLLQEVKLAISKKDEQLTEAYSHLTARQLVKFADYVSTLINSCEVASAINKASRKPRAKKAKPPAEVVKNVKYLDSDPSSGLKSEHPAKIVNATEVWLYNAKNRRLFKYVALGGLPMTVKGTTIINIDAEKSGGKIIRKPEVTLKDVANMTSRPLNALYKSIRGTESRAVGRLNEDTIIVKCFN